MAQDSICRTFLSHSARQLFFVGTVYTINWNYRISIGNINTCTYFKTMGPFTRAIFAAIYFSCGFSPFGGCEGVDEL